MQIFWGLVLYDTFPEDLSMAMSIVQEPVSNFMFQTKYFLNYCTYRNSKLAN